MNQSPRIFSDIAYVGDSQTDEGGIGDGLSSKCLDQKNIVGYHSAHPRVYTNDLKCFLPQAYQKESPEMYGPKGKVACTAAYNRFQDLIKRDDIKTVVIALGDNYPERDKKGDVTEYYHESHIRNFKNMIEQIKAAGKECVWVMPSKKRLNNTDVSDIESDYSIQDYENLAKQNCKAIINPSRGGVRYQVKADDGKHYDKASGAGNEIASQICDGLRHAFPSPAPRKGDSVQSKSVVH